MAKEAKNDFSAGSIPATILRLAGPLTMAQIINVLYNIVDRMYIGRLPEDAGLAMTGLGLSLPVVVLVIAFANLYGSGGAPLCSIERGRGNLKEAEAILGNSFTMLLLTGVCITVLGILCRRPFLYAFGASDATYPFADRYLSIYLCGTLFVMLEMGLNAFINAQGFAKTGMLTVLIGAVANIALDPLFIFVFRMGIAGAALASVLAQFLSAAWTLWFLFGKTAILRITKAGMRLRGERVGKIVTLGFSGFVMQFTNSVVTLACNSTLQSCGGDLYVEVMTIISSIREVIMMPIHGITAGSQPVISFNFGAKKYDRVLKAVRFMGMLLIGYTAIAWGAVHLFPGFFIRIFRKDATLIAATTPSMRLYYFGFIFMALQFTGQTTFQSLGRAKNAIFFSLFRKVVIVVPLTLLLPGLWSLGVKGVFLAEPISNFIGGSACFLTMLLIVVPDMRRRMADTSQGGV